MVMVIARKLGPYFQGYWVMVETKHLIRQLLMKLDLEGRMFSWEIEFSKYKIHYIPRRSIKLQLTDFLVEIRFLVGEKVSLVDMISVDGTSNLKGVVLG